MYSDGTGTVAEIAGAAARAGVDAVLLTDHDTLAARRRGEDGWYGSTLVCVGVEVSSRHGHYLAFGLDRRIKHRRLSPAQVIAEVADAGGFGFLAHPFSRGSRRFERLAAGMPWGDLDAPGYTGIELWSFVTDTAEAIRSIPDALRFIATPGRHVDHPPPENLAAWDRLTAKRPVVAIGGVDAHQIGRRIGDRVPLRLMSYRRSFSHLRTHVLVDRPLSGDAERDRRAIYASLRGGRCYLAMDSVAPARGFDFFAATAAGRIEQGAEGQAGSDTMLRARLPRAAAVTLLRNGEAVASHHTAGLEHRAERPGIYRVQALLSRYGRMRTWILSNPLYLR